MARRRKSVMQAPRSWRRSRDGDHRAGRRHAGLAGLHSGHEGRLAFADRGGGCCGDPPPRHDPSTRERRAWRDPSGRRARCDEASDLVRSTRRARPRRPAPRRGRRHAGSSARGPHEEADRLLAEVDRRDRAPGSPTGASESRRRASSTESSTPCASAPRTSGRHSAHASPRASSGAPPASTTSRACLVRAWHRIPAPIGSACGRHRDRRAGRHGRGAEILSAGSALVSSPRTRAGVRRPAHRAARRRAERQAELEAGELRRLPGRDARSTRATGGSAPPRRPACATAAARSPAPSSAR